MYESYSPYIQSEIDYRRERILSGTQSRKTRHHRFPRRRRAADTTSTTR